MMVWMIVDWLVGWLIGIHQINGFENEENWRVVQRDIKAAGSASEEALPTFG